MSGNEDRNSLNVTFDLNEDSKTSACRVGPAVTLKVSVICTNSRKRRDVTTWRVAKRRYQGVENKPLICIAV